MLVIQLKSREDILSLTLGNLVVICCRGCGEVYFPEAEVAEILEELFISRTVLAVVDTDYVCNPTHLVLQMKAHSRGIEAADTILVFSCGVGVQTVAEEFPGIPVNAACDTYPLPGNQGVTPLEYDCVQCGTCFLNDTGGICPITACSKSLVNGPCGGVENGKCEADKDMECGWVRIYRRLENLGLSHTISKPVMVRDYLD